MNLENGGPFSRRHLVICNWRDTAHPQAGGAELYCEEVARQLQRRGIKITLVTSRPGGTPARQTVDFGTIVRLGGTFTTYPLVLLWLLLHRRQVDGVIDSENGIPYFSPLSVRRRTPVVLLIHHVHQRQFDMYFPPIVARIGQWLERWGGRFVYGVRSICAVSPSARTELRRQLSFRGPVFVAPNGVTVGPTGADVERCPQPRIVCVGRLMPHKRYELLVEAASELRARWPSLQVHVVGDGERRAPLEREVVRAGLQASFVFHGRVSEAERDRLMATAWLTVSPSAGEGWGLSVMEAAAHGVPAVAFRVPGLRDSVRHGETGWLVDDTAQLAAAIDEALVSLADAGQAAQWAARCRQWSRRFTWESTATRILDVLTAEHDRLVRGWGERRRGHDAMTVVELSRGPATAGIVSGLRRTDQVRVRDDAMELLLGGADLSDVERALDRLGVPPHLVRSVRPAADDDLVGWMPVRGMRSPAGARDRAGEPGDDAEWFADAPAVAREH